MMGPQPVEDENFCLRWNDYEKKYAETFRTLREDEHFAGRNNIEAQKKGEPLLFC